MKGEIRRWKGNSRGVIRTLSKIKNNYLCSQKHSYVAQIVKLRRRQDFSLTLSWRRPLSYRNHSTDLRSKSMDWFLHDNCLRHKRILLGFKKHKIKWTRRFTLYLYYPLNFCVILIVLRLFSMRRSSSKTCYVVYF